MERCYGCGAEAEKHPIVGVAHAQDVEAGTDVLKNPNDASNFVGVHVCKDCHVNPEHRTAHALKCHFFERGEKALVGMILAGSENIGG